MKNEPAVTREMISTSPSRDGKGSREFAAQTPSKKRLRRQRHAVTIQDASANTGSGGLQPLC